MLSPRLATSQGGQRRSDINPLAAEKRHEQGWVDELHTSLDELIPAIREAVSTKTVKSMAYVGNVVDLWERLAEEDIEVNLGSDQTSLHNPWAGGYYPWVSPWRRASA
mgnify:CR=1 FL=1